MAYKLVLCKSKMDYTRMYSVKDLNSCVYMNNDWLHGSKIHTAWRALAAKGNYPGVLMHYSPEIKGMYMVDKDDNPVARTYVAVDADKTPIAHVDIRCANQVLRRIMEALLKTANIESDWDELRITKHFQVPGISYKKSYLLPIPNIDMVEVGDAYFKWNDEKKVFNISPKRIAGYRRIGYTYDWKGYIVAPDITPFDAIV